MSTIATRDIQVGMSGAHSDVPTAVEERQLVVVQRVQHQLHPDEAQQHRQPRTEVHQSGQQRADQEVELAQPHQREDVGREYQVRLLGQPVDRRDRVEGEQQVGRPERDDDDRHRGDQPLAALQDGEPHAVVVLARRQVLAGPAHQGVLAVVLSAARALAGQLHRGVDQEPTEEVEHPAELVDRRRADRDERAPHHQGEHDADEQGGLLVLLGDRQLAHDDDEDEQIVDRERVLRQPAGVELPGKPRAADREDAQAEQDSAAEEERQVPGRLAGRRFVRPPADDEDVDDQEHHGDGDGDRPHVGRDMHETSGGHDACAPEVSPTWFDGRRPGVVRASTRTVLTRPPLGDTPLRSLMVSRKSGSAESEG